MKTKYRIFSGLLALSLTASPFSLMAEEFTQEEAPEAVTAPQAEASPSSAAVHSGKIGTADWVIDTEGTLRISAGEFSTNNPDYLWPWQPYTDSIRRVDGSAPFVAKGNFSRCFYPGLESTSPVESVNLSGWDVSGVTSLALMFGDCVKLSSINLKGWDTSNVTEMSGVFRNCSSLKEISLPGWSTDSAVDLSSMFSGCTELTSLDLNSWNMSKAQSTNYMFSACEKLADLRIDEWDVSSLKSTRQMFSDCLKLTSLDLSKWKPEHLEKLFCMFAGCRSLTSVNIAGWDLPEDADISYIFSGCSEIASVTYTKSSANILPMLRGAVRKIWSPNGQDLYTIAELPELEDGQTCTLQRMAAAVVSITKVNVSGLEKSYPWTGRAITPDFTLTYEGLELKKGIDYTVKYSNNINPGTATITIDGVEDYSDSMTLNFEIVKEAEKIDLSSATVEGISKSYDAAGSAICPEPIVTLNGTTLVKDQDYILAWTNNTNPGTAALTITGTGSYTGSKTVNFTINAVAKELINLSTAQIEGIQASYTWTGKAITPAPSVRINDKTLTAGTDYTVSYKDNTAPGKAAVTITGKGDYTGTKTVNFEIVKAAVNLSSAQVEGVKADYPWTGKAITPAPVVRVNGKTLTAGTDYTVSYKDNTAPGKATLTITGKGDYTGTKTVNFNIVKEAAQPEVKAVTMYRLYNPNSGEHFYTANAAEKNHLASVGWKYEGEGWKAPETSKKPVYRLYNKNAGDHHYTLDKNERDTLIKIGWNDEGIGWYSDEAQGVPLYRQYNPNAKAGSHNYTTDKHENDELVKLGWKAEGIGWYGLK